jgi:glycosyltransferase involved in cell wall biosynthesis
VIHLSAVIPCFNARATVARAVASLQTQDAPAGSFEIVVVDDGSTDGSADCLEETRGTVPVRVLRQQNRGRAAARNLGAAASRGRALLFLDADVWAAPGLVSAHLRHHGEGARMLAVQGRTVPDPDTLVSPFMRTSHMMPDLTVRRPGALSPLQVVTRNLSVSADGFRAVGGFDEGFAGYGLEDVEFGLRFARAGGRIRYDHEALGVHHHVISLEAAVERQRSNGRAAVRLWHKHGRPWWLGLHLEIHPALLPLKRLVFRTGLVTRVVEAARPWAERRRRYLVLNECYNHLLWRGYYQGVFQALAERGLGGGTPREVQR